MDRNLLLNISFIVAGILGLVTLAYTESILHTMTGLESIILKFFVIQELIVMAIGTYGVIENMYIKMTVQTKKRIRISG